MTIEQKAKAYDEALKVLHKYDGAHIMLTQDLKEEMFPELAESEDEKIRNSLLRWLQSNSYTSIAGIQINDVIAWLEKQGEKPVELSKEEYRKAYYDGWNNCNLQHSQRLSDSNDVVKCLINGMKFYYEGNEEATWGTEKFSMKVKDILAWLEKQGEQKHGISELTKQKLNTLLNEALQKETPESWNEFLVQSEQSTAWSEEDERVRSAISIYLDWLDGRKDCAPRGEYSIRDMVVWLEKQGKQKPNANIQQKDFAPKIEPKFKVGDWITNGHCKCQITFIDSRYWYSKTCVLGNVIDIDKTFHLWTIQDAKDGDVLIDEDNNIGIYKEIEGVDWNSYIYLGCDNHLYGFSIGGSHVQNNTKPATKEQRDLLFQKMKEKGYEWDEEKKKLKKISQRMVSAEVKEALYDKPVEWSKEDERICNAIINDIATEKSTCYSKIGKGICDEQINWLKSLKERIGG